MLYQGLKPSPQDHLAVLKLWECSLHNRIPYLCSQSWSQDSAQGAVEVSQQNKEPWRWGTVVGRGWEVQVTATGSFFWLKTLPKARDLFQQLRETC